MIVTPIAPPPPSPILFRCACGVEQRFTRDELSATSPADPGVVPWTLVCAACGGRMKRILARLRDLDKGQGNYPISE